MSVCLPKTLRPCVLSVLLCILLALCGCESIVYTDVTEGSANEMVAHLVSQGIAAQKVPGQAEMFSVVVAEPDLARSIESLSAAGLPRSSYDSMGNVFKKEGVVSTPVEENARLIYALSQEVAGSIALIDGVLAARVHVVLPSTDVFGVTSAPSTASIFIKHRYGIPIEGEVTRIKHLVEKGIPDLQYEDISVFLFAALPERPSERPEWVNVLGIRVAASSQVYVWVFLALSFASIVASVGFCLWNSFGKKNNNG